MQPRDQHLFFHNLSEDRKRYFRKFEKFSLKMISLKKAIRFNQNCIREKLIPKGIRKYGRIRQDWQAVERLLLQRNSENSSQLEKI